MKNRKGELLLAGGLVVILSGILLAVLWPAPYVEFVDRAVERAVRQELDNWGDISKEDMKGITHLTFDGYRSMGSSYYTTFSTEVRTFADLQHMDGLESLTFQGCKIGDFESLAGIDTLEELNLMNCGVENLEPLSTLSTLTKLKLEKLYQVQEDETTPGRYKYTQIKSFSLLTTLTSLEILDLSGNDITNIPSLEALTALRSVDISSNPIGGLTALKALPNLEVILAENCKLSVFPHFEYPEVIRSLDFRNNEIAETERLENLTSLEILYLEGNPVTYDAASRLVGALPDTVVIDLDLEAMKEKEEIEEEEAERKKREAWPGTIVIEHGELDIINFPGNFWEDEPEEGHWVFPENDDSQDDEHNIITEDEETAVVPGKRSQWLTNPATGKVIYRELWEDEKESGIRIYVDDKLIYEYTAEGEMGMEAYSQNVRWLDEDTVLGSYWGERFLYHVSQDRFWYITYPFDQKPPMLDGNRLDYDEIRESSIIYTTGGTVNINLPTKSLIYYAYYEPRGKYTLLYYNWETGVSFPFYEEPNLPTTEAIILWTYIEDENFLFFSSGASEDFQEDEKETIYRVNIPAQTIEPLLTLGPESNLKRDTGRYMAVTRFSDVQFKEQYAYGEFDYPKEIIVHDIVEGRNIFRAYGTYDYMYEERYLLYHDEEAYYVFDAEELRHIRLSREELRELTRKTSLNMLFEYSVGGVKSILDFEAIFNGS